MDGAGTVRGMDSIFAERAALETIGWIVPLVLAGLGWIFRATIGRWWRALRELLGKRRARSDALDVFIRTHMPVLVDFVTSSREREAKATQRETRITTQMQAFGEHLSRQDDKLDSIAAQLWASARFDVQARFRCDHNGRNLSVNDAYAKLMRVSEFELGELRWKSRLDEQDAERYLTSVQRCFREHRRFEGQAIFRRGDSTRFRAHVRIEPYPEDADDLDDGKHPTWFGSILLLEELS